MKSLQQTNPEPAMEKYLISLLELNRRVIVPGLGAFIIRQKEPKEMVFNDLLAFDDGMLTEKVMQDEQLSKSEARSRIKQFVEKVKEDLEAGKPCKLEGLGTLVMDASSRIEFAGTKQQATEPEETTPGTGGEMKNDKEQAEPAKTRTEPGPAESEAGKPAAEPADEASEAKPHTTGFVLAESDVEVDVDATREAEPLVPDREEPPFQIDDGGEPEIPEQEARVTRQETETEEQSFAAYTQPLVRRSRTWPWILGASVIVVGLLVTAWFLFPEKVRNIFHLEIGAGTTVERPEPESPPEEGAVPAEARVREEIPGDTPEAAVPGSDARASDKRYYVVAGCFADIRNAENYVSRLRNLGYEASIFGMRENLHAVCFNSHPSKQAALEELERIRSTYDRDAWLLYY